LFGKPEFINSKNISTCELNYFMEEAQRQNVQIFPIAISHINDDKNPLREIQFVNDPIESFDKLSDERLYAV
jgi:hypothetical protein